MHATRLPKHIFDTERTADKGELECRYVRQEHLTLSKVAHNASAGDTRPSTHGLLEPRASRSVSGPSRQAWHWHSPSLEERSRAEHESHTHDTELAESQHQPPPVQLRPKQAAGVDMDSDGRHPRE
jgi:hypothetical protein